MSTSTSRAAPFSASREPPSDIPVDVREEYVRNRSPAMTTLGPNSERTQENVEGPQEKDVDERVTTVTTLPLSTINDLQEPVRDTTTPEGTVSKVFHPNLDNADAVLKASDGILFHVNFAIVNNASNNAFGSALQGNVAHIFVVDELSASLDIILHIVYDWPVGQSTLTLKALLNAVDHMPYYGLSVQQFIHPTTHIFSLMSSMAVHHPLEIYTLAAHHFLHALAVLASRRLLSCDIYTLSGPTINRMGAFYFKKLADLHISRISALQRIVGTFPVFEHGQCAKDAQTAWALAALDVTRDGKPVVIDYSPDRMTSTMAVYALHVQCERCQHDFLQAVSDAVAQWILIPATVA